MKVTERPDGIDEDAPVALHRHVTVFQPVTAERRARVLRSVGLIADARGLSLDAVVVRAEDLPSHDPVEADAVASRQAERSRCEAELDAAERQRAESEATLATLVHDRAARQGRRDAALAAVDATTARRRTAVEEAMAAAAALESVRSLTTGDGADPAAELAAARQQLAEAEAEADTADPDHDDSPLNRRMADLERHRVHLARRLAATGDSAAVAVGRSLTPVMKGTEGSPPMAVALALADAWRDLHQQIEALDRGVPDAERTADTQLAQARRSLAEAEIVANQPLLTPGQIAKVESAHHDVLEAQDRSEARFGGNRARKRLDDLRSDERRVLERLGFSTYADYMMSSSGRDMSSSRTSVEVARTAVLAAQEHLDSLPGAADRARRRIELLERRNVVAPKISALLGYDPAGPEAEDELRTLREPVGDDQAALSVLASALGEAGIDVGPSPFERDDLVLLARAYLAEDRRAEAERLDLESAIGAVDEAVIVLRAARDRGDVDVPDDLTLPALAEPAGSHDDTGPSLREARWAAVEAARITVADVEARVARHRGMSDEVAALEAALDQASRREQEAADHLAVAEAAVADAGGDAALEQAATAVADAEASLARTRSTETAAVDALAAVGGTGTEALQASNEAAEAADAAASAQDREALIGDIDWALLNRLAAVRPADGSEPVPLVLDEPFGILSDDEVTGVLERLTRFAPLAQIVVVSNRPAVVDWAASAGPDRVGVVTA